MNDIIDDVISDNFTIIDELVTKIRTLLNELNESFKDESRHLIKIYEYTRLTGRSPNNFPEKYAKLQTYVGMLYHEISQLFLCVVDVYFIRRFLDKDYIANGIAYNGADHSIHFVYLLVKYFNFKLTHIYPSPINTNIETLNKCAKDAKTFDDIFISKFCTEKQQQCIDMSSFPKNML